MRKIISNIFFALSVLLLIACCFFAYQASTNKEEAFVFGYKPYVITTGSMEPKLRVNGVVIVKKGGYDDIKVNDIINFKVSKDTNQTACHQVIQITKNGFVTKGINNDQPDQVLTTEENYVGKVVAYTNITAYFISNLKTPSGIIKLIVLPVIGIILLIVGIRLLRNKRINKDSI